MTLLPRDPAKRPPLEVRPDPAQLNRRKYKRQAYASLQKRLQRNFGRAARDVIDGVWDKQPKEPDANTIDFWTSLLRRESQWVNLDLPPAGRGQIKWDLMRPVTSSEVKNALVGVSGSPGPEGLSW